MKVTVDEQKCLGCGTCVALAPKTFRINNQGKAEVTEPIGDEPKTVKEAAEACPVEAIIIEE